MSTTAAALQSRLQALSTEFQKLQNDLSNAVEARQRLDAQLSENELVRKEFEQLTPDNTVYKMIGPVLVPQDQADAKGIVNKRLDFIKDDIKRVEAQLKDLGEKSDRKKAELVEVQTALQQELQKTAGPSGAAA